MKKIILACTFMLFGCVGIKTGDMDLDNPFENEYKIRIENSKGVNGHDDIERLSKDLEDAGINNRKTIKLSYSVKNKQSEMNSTYGKMVLPFEIFTLGAVDLLGIPSDFMAQTVYMNAKLENEQGRTISTYSSSGSAWHTVAMYYGYGFTDAKRMANVRAFNKALNELYQNINKENQIESSSGFNLTNKDCDTLVNNLVNDILASGSLDNTGEKYILIISDIKTDTIHDVDTDIFVKKLRIALQKENKVRMSTMTEDKMIMKSRELRRSSETNQTNVAKKNALSAPNISLTGMIVEKELSSDKSEYTIMLTINDLKNGISLWEGEQSLIKTGKE